jgi:hypothetical protein
MDTYDPTETIECLEHNAEPDEKQVHTEKPGSKELLAKGFGEAFGLEYQQEMKVMA